MYPEVSEEDGQEACHQLVLLSGAVSGLAYLSAAFRAESHILRDFGATVRAIDIFDYRCSAMRACFCGIRNRLAAFLTSYKCHYVEF